MGRGVEELFGGNVLHDEDQGATKSAEDAPEVAGELSGAGEHDAEGERDEGKVGCASVVYLEEEAVDEDGKEGGEAFDGVYEGNRYLGRSGGGEDVAAELEDGERDSGAENVAAGRADAMLECGDGAAQGGNVLGERGGDDAEGRG